MVIGIEYNFGHENLLTLITSKDKPVNMNSAGNWIK